MARPLDNSFDFLRPKDIDYDPGVIRNKNRIDASIFNMPKPGNPWDELRVNDFVHSAPLNRRMDDVSMAQINFGEDSLRPRPGSSSETTGTTGGPIGPGGLGWGPGGWAPPAWGPRTPTVTSGTPSVASTPFIPNLFGTSTSSGSTVSGATGTTVSGATGATGATGSSSSSSERKTDSDAGTAGTAAGTAVAAPVPGSRFIEITPRAAKTDPFNPLEKSIYDYFLNLLMDLGFPSDFSVEKATSITETIAAPTLPDEYFRLPPLLLQKATGTGGLLKESLKGVFYVSSIINAGSRIELSEARLGDLIVIGKDCILNLSKVKDYSEATIDLLNAVGYVIPLMTEMMFMWGDPTSEAEITDFAMTSFLFCDILRVLSDKFSADPRIQTFVDRDILGGVMGDYDPGYATDPSNDIRVLRTLIFYAAGTVINDRANWADPIAKYAEVASLLLNLKKSLPPDVVKTQNLIRGLYPMISGPVAREVIGIIANAFSDYEEAEVIGQTFAGGAPKRLTEIVSRRRLSRRAAP